MDRKSPPPYSLALKNHNNNFTYSFVSNFDKSLSSTPLSTFSKSMTSQCLLTATSMYSSNNFPISNNNAPINTETEIALKAAKMVEMLACENESLRKTLEQYDKKLGQLQKLEMALENTQRGHDILIQANEKREHLEKLMRIKLESEIRRLKDHNQILIDQLRHTGKMPLKSSTESNKNWGNETTNDSCTFTNEQYKATSMENVNSELNKKDMVISQLINQNKELLMANEEKQIKVASLQNTLNEQSSQLEVLQKALLQAQTNVLRLEEIISSLADHFPPFIRKLLKDQLSTIPSIANAPAFSSSLCSLTNLNNCGTASSSSQTLSSTHFLTISQPSNSHDGQSKTNSSNFMNTSLLSRNYENSHDLQSKDGYGRAPSYSSHLQVSLCQQSNAQNVNRYPVVREAIESSAGLEQIFQFSPYPNISKQYSIIPHSASSDTTLNRYHYENYQVDEEDSTMKIISTASNAYLPYGMKQLGNSQESLPASYLQYYDNTELMERIKNLKVSVAKKEAMIMDLLKERQLQPHSQSPIPPNTNTQYFGYQPANPSSENLKPPGASTAIIKRNSEQNIQFSNFRLPAPGPATFYAKTEVSCVDNFNRISSGIPVSGYAANISAKKSSFDQVYANSFTTTTVAGKVSDNCINSKIYRI